MSFDVPIHFSWLTTQPKKPYFPLDERFDTTLLLSLHSIQLAIIFFDKRNITDDLRAKEKYHGSLLAVPKHPSKRSVIQNGGSIRGTAAGSFVVDGTHGKSRDRVSLSVRLPLRVRSISSEHPQCSV